ncbi:MAG: hypothetical protein AB7S26_42580 [Sandaracinaceae bacterium]
MRIAAHRIGRSISMVSALAAVTLHAGATTGCAGSHPTEQEAYAQTAAAACGDAMITASDAQALWTTAGAAPLSCAAKARTCAEYEACQTPPPDPCTGPDACDGNTLVRCTDGVETRIGCDACVDIDGPTCVTREETCEATRCVNEYVLSSCIAGQAVLEHDCRDRLGGGICAVEGGASACRPTTAECDDGRAECDGDTGRICYEGVWIEFRCGDIEGHTCQVPEAGVVRCIVL